MTDCPFPSCAQIRTTRRTGRIVRLPSRRSRFLPRALADPAASPPPPRRRTLPPPAPPYPPNRLRKGHALAFFPDPSTSLPGAVRTKEQIWDDGARDAEPNWWDTVEQRRPATGGASF